jgi:polar amino acid transport system substrate-binding protein
MGAEIILPLHAAGPLLGWIFVGQRATGIPFERHDLEDLADLADHISTTLEKALQYKETALQKALAETLLHSIPFGIIACDEQAVIRWFNSSARDILMPLEQGVIGRQAEVLGSHVADRLHTTLASSERLPVFEWIDPRTKRTLSAETRCLMGQGTCVGAMMMLRDITGAKLLQEKEEQLERAAFWTDLAAGMSHEIRNPLVAIKTFAQLLPDRYEDPDFRAEFGEQVTAEVDKLNEIIDKINNFADHRRLDFKPLDVRRPIENAVTKLQAELDHENLKIHLSSDDSALQVKGDMESLEECMYHLLLNAAENLGNKEDARINVSVKSREPDSGPAKVFMVVSDNGSGIDESVRDKLFSPFSTIKARGLGLGLPIAKRAVIDHNGQLDIETGPGGTAVTISLPAIAAS